MMQLQADELYGTQPTSTAATASEHLEQLKQRLQIARELMQLRRKIELIAKENETVLVADALKEQFDAIDEKIVKLQANAKTNFEALQQVVGGSAVDFDAALRGGDISEIGESLFSVNVDANARKAYAQAVKSIKDQDLDPASCLAALETALMAQAKVKRAKAHTQVREAMTHAQERFDKSEARLAEIQTLAERLPGLYDDVAARLATLNRRPVSKIAMPAKADIVAVEQDANVLAELQKSQQAMHLILQKQAAALKQLKTTPEQLTDALNAMEDDVAALGKVEVALGEVKQSPVREAKQAIMQRAQQLVARLHQVKEVFGYQSSTSAEGVIADIEKGLAAADTEIKKLEGEIGLTDAETNLAAAMKQLEAAKEDRRQMLLVANPKTPTRNDIIRAFNKELAQLREVARQQKGVNDLRKRYHLTNIDHEIEEIDQKTTRSRARLEGYKEKIESEIEANQTEIDRLSSEMPDINVESDQDTIEDLEEALVILKQQAVLLEKRYDLERDLAQCQMGLGQGFPTEQQVKALDSSILVRALIQAVQVRLAEARVSALSDLGQALPELLADYDKVVAASTAIAIAGREVVEQDDQIMGAVGLRSSYMQDEPLKVEVTALKEHQAKLERAATTVLQHSRQVIARLSQEHADVAELVATSSEISAFLSRTFGHSAKETQALLQDYQVLLSLQKAHENVVSVFLRLGLVPPGDIHSTYAKLNTQVAYVEKELKHRHQTLAARVAKSQQQRPDAWTDVGRAQAQVAFSELMQALQAQQAFEREISTFCKEKGIECPVAMDIEVTAGRLVELQQELQQESQNISKAIEGVREEIAGIDRSIKSIILVADDEKAKLYQQKAEKLHALYDLYDKKRQLAAIIDPEAVEKLQEELKQIQADYKAASQQASAALLAHLQAQVELSGLDWSSHTDAVASFNEQFAKCMNLAPALAATYQAIVANEAARLAQAQAWGIELGESTALSEAREALQTLYNEALTHALDLGRETKPVIRRGRSFSDLVDFVKSLADTQSADEVAHEVASLAQRVHAHEKLLRLESALADTDVEVSPDTKKQHEALQQQFAKAQAKLAAHAQKLAAVQKDKRDLEDRVAFELDEDGTALVEPFYLLVGARLNVYQRIQALQQQENKFLDAVVAAREAITYLPEGLGDVFGHEAFKVDPHALTQEIEGVTKVIGNLRGSVVAKADTSIGKAEQRVDAKKQKVGEEVDSINTQLDLLGNEVTQFLARMPGLQAEVTAANAALAKAKDSLRIEVELGADPFSEAKGVWEQAKLEQKDDVLEDARVKLQAAQGLQTALQAKGVEVSYLCEQQQGENLKVYAAQIQAQARMMQQYFRSRLLFVLSDGSDEVRQACQERLNNAVDELDKAIASGQLDLEGVQAFQKQVSDVGVDYHNWLAGQCGLDTNADAYQANLAELLGRKDFDAHVWEQTLGKAGAGFDAATVLIQKRDEVVKDEMLPLVEKLRLLTEIEARQQSLGEIADRDETKTIISGLVQLNVNAADLRELLDTIRSEIIDDFRAR